MVETDDAIRFVLELLPGGDLLDLIARRRLTEAESVARIAEILAETLQWLHNLEIIHCDLKPENCLLLDECDLESLKLIDFGLSRFLSDGDGMPGVDTDATSGLHGELTELGDGVTPRIGTSEYMSPEVQYMSTAGYSCDADLWSLGVVLYVLLSGSHFPFRLDRSNEGEMQVQVMAARFPRLRSTQSMDLQIVGPRLFCWSASCCSRQPHGSLWILCCCIHGL